MIRAYFVDTGYLCELYAIDGRSETLAIAAVREKFATAWTNGDLLFLPAFCVIEVGNHIAQVKNVLARSKLARRLVEDVAQALDDRQPSRRFTVQDAPPLHELPALLRAWLAGHVSGGRGLVDAALADKARAFKASLPGRAYSVHIWSRDRALKFLEPDAEPAPFL